MSQLTGKRPVVKSLTTHSYTFTHVDVSLEETDSSYSFDWSNGSRLKLEFGLDLGLEPILIFNPGMRINVDPSLRFSCGCEVWVAAAGLM